MLRSFPPPLPFQPVWAGVTHNRASTAAAAAAVAASETAPSMDAALAVAAHSAEAAAVGGEHAAEGSTAFAAARPPAAKRRHKRDDAAASAAPQQQEAAPEQQQEQKQKQEQEQEPEQEPIDLDAVSNEAELVEMGLDRLKAALSARGLKCRCVRECTASNATRAHLITRHVAAARRRSAPRVFSPSKDSLRSITPPSCVQTRRSAAAGSVVREQQCNAIQRSVAVQRWRSICFEVAV